MTRADLALKLRELGLRQGIVMVHASLKSFGWIVGGSESIIRALLDVVGEEGTICAQVAWEEERWYDGAWTPGWRERRDELPAFDPIVAESASFEGRLAERLRTWPGAKRSEHPASGLAAVGRHAAWLTHAHPLIDGFGPRSPYAKLVESHAQVLLLGAPLWSVSLLHHAEALVDLPSKRKARYRMPFVENAGRTWKMIEGIDSTRGAFPYARLFGNREEAFSQLVAAALSAKCGRACEAGQARCHVFEAALLVNFAIEWLRHQFSVQ